MGDFSELAIRIKDLRQSLGMTQREFAKKAGCTAATLSAYENSSKSPSLEVVMGIAEAFNVSIDWLCGYFIKGNNTDEIKTYADIIRIFSKLLAIDMPGNRFYLHARYDDFLEIVETGILNNDENLYLIIQDIEKMQNVLKDGTISQDIYNTWLEGFLEKHNVPLKPTE